MATRLLHVSPVGMQQLSWMLARLACSTGDLHATVDEAWTAPLEVPTRAAYKTYLACTYAFLVPFEAALVSRSELANGFLQPRIRSGRVAADLLALRLGPYEHRILAREFPVHAFDTVEALGWLYVSERAMLYAHRLCEHLTHTLPREISTAHAYLTAYDGVANERWLELGETLDRTATTAANVGDRIVGAARLALATQLHWLETLVDAVDAVDVPMVKIAS